MVPREGRASAQEGRLQALPLEAKQPFLMDPHPVYQGNEGQPGLLGTRFIADQPPSVPHLLRTVSGVSGTDQLKRQV